MTDSNWQTRAAEFAQKRNLHRTPGVYALDLMSELGEVAKELLIASAYGTKEPEYDANLAGELGDVLYSLCLLATAVNIDLEEALTATLQKYETRWQQSSHLGSQSE
ncbi:MAG: hypothetical protein KC443_22580 [Anaerolineales bacterium]|nr:hypothetical protein [Anaerolineales bacterium]